MRSHQTREPADLTFGRHLIFVAAIPCLFTPDTLGMATQALREWLVPRCSAGRAAKLILHFRETSAPLMCTWNEIFRLHCFLPGISESAYHRVDNFRKVVIFHLNSIFVSSSME